MAKQALNRAIGAAKMAGKGGVGAVKLAGNTAEQLKEPVGQLAGLGSAVVGGAGSVVVAGAGQAGEAVSAFNTSAGGGGGFQ